MGQPKQTSDGRFKSRTRWCEKILEETKTVSSDLNNLLYKKLDKSTKLIKSMQVLIWLMQDNFKPTNLSSSVTIIIIYYMPSTFYIVKLPLALGNIFNCTESILAQSHDNAKNP